MWSRRQLEHQQQFDYPCRQPLSSQQFPSRRPLGLVFIIHKLIPIVLQSVGQSKKERGKNNPSRPKVENSGASMKRRQK